MNRVILLLLPLILGSCLYTTVGGPDYRPPYKSSYVPFFVDHAGRRVERSIDSICAVARCDSGFRCQVFGIDSRLDVLVARTKTARVDTVYPFLVLPRTKPRLEWGGSNIRAVSRFYAAQWVATNPELALRINWARESVLYLRDKHYYYTRYGNDDISGSGLIVKVSLVGALVDTSYQYSED